MDVLRSVLIRPSLLCVDVMPDTLSAQMEDLA